MRAAYVIAADGAHSPVRERLGIRMLGHGSFSDSITIYFRADVRRLIGDRNLSVVYVFGPSLQGFFRFSIDLQAGFLVVNSTADADGTRSVRIGEDMSEPTCVRYVREALGAPGHPGRDRERAALVGDGRLRGASPRRADLPRRRRGTRHAADRRLRREFGVQDAYDLAWKLAYVLDGRADERCSPRTTPSASRSARSRPSRRTRATCSASTRRSARRTCCPSSKRRPSSSAIAIAHRPSRASRRTMRAGRTRAHRPAVPGSAPRTSRSPATAPSARRSICSGPTSSCSRERAARLVHGSAVGRRLARRRRRCVPCGRRHRRRDRKRRSALRHGRRRRCAHPARRVRRLAGVRRGAGSRGRSHAGAALGDRPVIFTCRASRRRRGD